MSKASTFIKLIKKPRLLLGPLAKLGIFKWMNDEDYLKFAYKCLTGDTLHLDNPYTFTEKIQWLKLHDHQLRYIQLVDKLLVKDYVEQMIGDEYIIPTLNVWNSVSEIDYNSLPDRFVLKCNHDSGSVVICRDKNSFDKKAASKYLSKCLRRNPYYWGREWPYKYVKRKVFAEYYLEDLKSKVLIDYKFYCFNGNPKYCQVIKNRGSKETIDFFDMKWIHQPFIGLTPNVKNSDDIIREPYNFEKMKTFSNILSKNTYFCRIDFYEVNNRLFFGEITFYPNAGFGCFRPKDWNLKLGSLIKI